MSRGFLGTSLLLVLGASAAASDAPDLLAQQRALQHYRNGQERLLSDAFGEAAEEFGLAIQLDPGMPLAHYGLGQAHMGLKNFVQAIQAFRRCQEAYEDQGATAVARGERLNRWIEDEITALRDMQRQLEARARQAGASLLIQRQLLRVNSRLEQLDRMRQRHDRVATTPPGVFLALGSAYLRAGQLPEAEREYRAALHGNPRMGEAHNNLAYLYMVSGRLQEAERELAQAEKKGFKVHPDFKNELKSKLH